MLCLLFMVASSAIAAQVASPQWGPLNRGSDNIEVVGHLPLGAHNNLADMDIEQEMHRPYAYVARARYDGLGPVGMVVVDISDPAKPTKITEWQIENQDLHIGGAMDVKYFKWDGRYYVVQSLQFRQGGPNPDLGAVVLDVTDLPDPESVREVARIREPDLPGGFHNIFIYKHSNDRVYLLATVSGPFANIYDLGTLIDEGPENALAGQIPTPGADRTARGYHDFYAAYHPDSGQDRFYGGGTGGYFVYDFTNIDSPEVIATLTGIQGITRGHTFTPTPDGRYVIAESEYQYAAPPDLRPAAGLGRRADEHQPPDLRVDRPLGASRAQPRGPLAVCVRIGLPGRTADLRDVGPQEPKDGGLLRYVPGGAWSRMNNPSCEAASGWTCGTRTA